MVGRGTGRSRVARAREETDPIAQGTLGDLGDGLVLVAAAPEQETHAASPDGLEEDTQAIPEQRGPVPATAKAAGPKLGPSESGRDAAPSASSDALHARAQAVTQPEIVVAPEPPSPAALPPAAEHLPSPPDFGDEPELLASAEFEVLPLPLPGELGEELPPLKDASDVLLAMAAEEAGIAGAEAEPAPEVRTASAVHEGRSFGASGRAPTPPALEVAALVAEPLPLRREESVIAEAAALRGGPMVALQKLKKRLGTLSSTRGLDFVNAVAEVSLRGLERFQRLPRKKQLLWVATPYLCAALLVWVLFEMNRRGDGEAEGPVVAVDTTAPAAAPANTVVRVRVKPMEPETPEVERPEAAPAQVATPEVPTPEVPTPEAAREAPTAKTIAVEPAAAALGGEARVLPVRSALYIRPDAAVAKAARLRAGSKLTVFSAFDAPEGWVLAQSEKGTIGFVSTLHLEGKRDPAIDLEPGTTKKTRRR